VACAAVAAAHEQGAKLIVVLTDGGLIARMVSKFQPVPPVLVVCESDRVCRQAYISRGVIPMVAKLRKKGLQAALQQSLALAKTVGYVETGDSSAILLFAWKDACIYWPIVDLS
jgi:pyruvate kinase